MELSLSRRSILAISAVAIAAACSLGYVFHINGDSLDFSDTEAKIVVSGSMDGQPRDYPIKTIPTGSMVVIHRVPDDSASFYSSLAAGDVLTFRYTHPVSKERMVVTHRIISISESSGVYTYTLKGDSLDDDPTNGSVQEVTSDSGDVIGKVVGVSHWLGLLAAFMSSWTGKFCLVLVPCAILIASEVRNIFRIIRDGEDEEGSGNGGSPKGLIGKDIAEACPEPISKAKEPLFITAEERIAARGGHIER